MYVGRPGLVDERGWLISLIYQNTIEPIAKKVPYRPLTRRLDRCDRVIKNEGDDSFGGNV